MAYAAAAQPPHIHHSTVRISPANAQSQLQTYLEKASTEAHLQPNALLTLNGPVSANDSEEGGLVLYNLRRLEAGLRGKVLAAEELKPEDVPMEDLPNVPMEEEIAQAKMKVDQAGGGKEGDWQDPEIYSREQVEEVEDMGDRQTGIQDGGDIPLVREVDSEGQQAPGEKSAKKKKKHAKKSKKPEPEHKTNGSDQPVNGNLSNIVGESPTKMGSDKKKTQREKIKEKKRKRKSEAQNQHEVDHGLEGTNERPDTPKKKAKEDHNHKETEETSSPSEKKKSKKSKDKIKAPGQQGVDQKSEETDQTSGPPKKKAKKDHSLGETSESSGPSEKKKKKRRQSQPQARDQQEVNHKHGRANEISGTSKKKTK